MRMYCSLISTASASLVSLIDKVYHHFHHHVLLLGATFRNHQRKSYKGAVGYTLGAVGVVQNVVVVEKPKEQCAAIRLLPSLNEWFFTTR